MSIDKATIDVVKAELNARFREERFVADSATGTPYDRGYSDALADFYVWLTGEPPGKK